MIKASRFSNSAHDHAPDLDADWMALAQKVEVVSPRHTTDRVLFIPSFPVRFLLAIQPCADAIPVLLLALAQMRMRDVNEMALGAHIWSLAGSPSRRVKARLLSQIAGLPDEVCTLVSRPGRPHLLRAGPQWPGKHSR